MRGVLHHAAAAIAIMAAVAFIVLGFLSAQRLDERRHAADKLRTTFMPASAGPSDFVAGGWRYRKRQWWAFGVLCAAILVWGATG